MVILFYWSFYTYGGEYDNSNIALYRNYGMFCFGSYTTTPYISANNHMTLPLSEGRRFRRDWGESSTADVPWQIWENWFNSGEPNRRYLPAPLI